MDEKPKAFVIMPFDIEFKSIYQKLIKEPLEEAGYEVARADSFLNQRNILSDIIRGIRNANLIVADLTTNNPNVFYELGLCHGLSVPTVLIAQSINDIPFDLQSYKILIYETHFNKIEKLKKTLRDIGEKHQLGTIEFGNPVIDFSQKRFEAPEKAVKEVSVKVSNQSIEADEEKEFLDYLKDGEEASNDLTSVLGKLLKDNQVITNRITKHASSMQALSNNSAAGSAGKFHRIALLAASDMNNFSKKVEDALPTFEEAINRLDENYSGVIKTAKLETADEENLVAFRKTMASLLDGSKDARTSMESYRDAVKGIEERKISRDLSRASRRQAEAINGIINNIQRVEAFCEKTLTMFDDKFGDFSKSSSSKGESAAG